MSKEIQERYLELSHALGDLGEPPACAEPENIDLFFPESYSRADVTPASIQRKVFADLAKARELCDDCPVKVECLSYALAANEEFGIWSGTTPAERRAISGVRTKLAR